MTGDEQNDRATRNLPSSQQSDQSGLKEQSPASTLCSGLVVINVSVRPFSYRVTTVMDTVVQSNEIID